MAKFFSGGADVHLGIILGALLDRINVSPKNTHLISFWVLFVYICYGKLGNSC